MRVACPVSNVRVSPCIPQVSELLTALRSVCATVSLCGAGGGGFAVGIMNGEVHVLLLCGGGLVHVHWRVSQE